MIRVYWRIAACGAMGGFLSVALGFRELEIDLDSNWITNCLVGASRILIACSAAIFAMFLIKSGFALQFFDSPNGEYGLYSVATVAGFSLRFVPNLIEDLGQQSSPSTGSKNGSSG